jgi:hypothetical protein
MKTRLNIALLVTAALLAVAVQAVSAHGQGRRGRFGDSEADLPEREEINRSFDLSPGATVELSGLNGAVRIETAPGTAAEVHIVRSARNKEDLNYRRLLVEQTPSRLVIRPERDDEWDRGGRNRTIRERITLKLPRQVELTMSGINGGATVGEIDGPVNLSGINGSVDVAQATGYSELSGINGVVTIKIARLGERGLRISGVNGGLEILFTADIDADLDVSGTNGAVDTELANVTLQGKQSRTSFRARIGSGGIPIMVDGVNGHVRLRRAGSAG